MICPSCGEISAVQSTRALVGAGTQNTAGSALTFPVVGSHNISSTVFASTTSSGLATRLRPPTFPRARMWPWVLIFTALFVYEVPPIWFNSLFRETDLTYFSGSGLLFSIVLCLFGLLIGIILGLIFGVIMRAIGNVTWLAGARKAWYPRAERVWSSFYCGRDDTMFDQWYSSTPEGFIYHVWVSVLDGEEIEEDEPEKVEPERFPLYKFGDDENSSVPAQINEKPSPADLVDPSQFRGNAALIGAETSSPEIHSSTGKTSDQSSIPELNFCTSCGSQREIPAAQFCVNCGTAF